MIFFKYLFSPRKIARKKITKSRIQTGHATRRNPSSRWCELGIERFGNRAQTATPHRSLERPHGKPREETFASFRSALYSLVPSSRPRTDGKRMSRSKNETTLEMFIIESGSKKKAVGKIFRNRPRCAAMRSDVLGPWWP